MPRPVSIVRGGSWLHPVTEQIEARGLETVLGDALLPTRDDVLCTLVSYDALSDGERGWLVKTLQAGEWVRPCLLAVERRLDPAVGLCLRAGLHHLVAMTPQGPRVPMAFAQALRRLSGSPRSSVSGYLDARRSSQAHRVTRSSDKASVVAAVGAVAQRQGAAARLVEAVRTATDELVTNVLYNAPTDAAGRPRYAHLQRSVQVTLEPTEMAEVTVSADGHHLVLRVTDPFGSLAPERLSAVLARGLAETDVEARSGGAGLGLGWVFRHAAHLIATLSIGRSTEIVAVFDLTITHRAHAGLPQSLDIFVEQGAPPTEPAPAFLESST